VIKKKTCGFKEIFEINTANLHNYQNRYSREIKFETICKQNYKKQLFFELIRDRNIAKFILVKKTKYIRINT